MKKLNITAILCSLILFITSCGGSDNKTEEGATTSKSVDERHIGEWKGTDYTGKSATLILDKSNHAVLVQDNQVIGGKEFELNKIKAECKYDIDYAKNPLWLDLVIYEQGKTEELGRLKGIVRFITDNKIEYRLNFNGERFDKFDPEDKESTIVLDKVKN
jgi:hypothetical protein